MHQTHHDTVLRGHGYHPLRVKQVVKESDDASSFVLDIPAELRTTFDYSPGQFCTLRVRIGGEDHFRSYSMSSTPGIDPDLTVTVKRVAGGLVSNWLLDHVTQGSLVQTAKPAGVFCPRDGAHPVIAFCGGSGITPVMSIIKHELAASRRSITLFYANRDPGSVIFDGALGALGRAHPERLAVRHHFDIDHGFAAPGDVSALVGDQLGADFYICGPGPFMDIVESTLLGLGVAPHRIFIERFGVEGQGEDAAGASPGEPDAREAPESRPPAAITVILGGRSTTVAYRPGDTVLETARRGGLRPPFSCEAGNCATCMAFLKEGSVRMRANNALTPDEVAQGWILTCQSLPTGQAVTVEYEAM